MNVVIYARVSSTEQASGYSIDAQIDASRQWANEQGYVVVQVYIEPGKSAKTDDRPVFRRMIRNVCLGEAKAIVVHKVDRFARNLHDLLFYKKQLRDHEATIFSATEIFFNGDSPENELVMNVLGAVGQYVALNIGKESQKGIAAKIAAGDYPGSQLALGYCRVGKKKGSMIQICPIRGPQIQTAFETIATGKYTLAAWTKLAEERGYRNRDEGVISSSSWQFIFRNIFYLGKFKWNDELHQGNHPPLIDHKLWQQVQTLLEARNNGGSAQRHFWLLRDLLWSDVHAKPMSGNLAKGTIPYYRAQKRAHLDPIEHNIRAEEAEGQVLKLLATIQVSYQAIPAPDEWVLALRSVPNISLVYEQLSTEKAKRTFLQMVFLKHGLHVNQAGRVKVAYLRPGFELISRKPKNRKTKKKQ